MDGSSLVPIIKGRPQQRESIFLQYDGNGSLGSSQRCVIKGNFKFVVDMFKDESYLELYDVLKDPKETDNLLFNPSFAGVADDMIRELSNYMKQTGDRLSLAADLRTRFLKNYKNGIQKSDKLQ